MGPWDTVLEHAPLPPWPQEVEESMRQYVDMGQRFGKLYTGVWPNDEIDTWRGIHRAKFAPAIPSSLPAADRVLADFAPRHWRARPSYMQDTVSMSDTVAEENARSAA